MAPGSYPSMIHSPEMGSLTWHGWITGGRVQLHRYSIFFGAASSHDIQFLLLIPNTFSRLFLGGALEVYWLQNCKHDLISWECCLYSYIYIYEFYNHLWSQGSRERERKSEREGDKYIYNINKHTCTLWNSTQHSERKWIYNSFLDSAPTYPA